MNRLKHMYEEINDIEGDTVKKVSIDYEGKTAACIIETDGLITHRIFHERSCCELIRINPPKNITNLPGRTIFAVMVESAENEVADYDYRFLANVKIMDSRGEEYIIEFEGKSIGCGYEPCIVAQREWIACVFD